MTINTEIIDQLLKNYKSPEDLTGPDGLLKQLTAAVVSRALDAELTAHLGYDKGDPDGRGSGNSRNGQTNKTVRSEQGNLEITVPRDRLGDFEPQLVKKHQRHFTGFDDKILSMYSRGMSARDIKAHLEELYAVDVSPDLISRVTDSVMEEITSWQSRPLDSIYPIVIVDALVVKVRDSGVVRNKSAYIALAIDLEGNKVVVGIWIEQTEGAKFWLKILNELKNRGVQDILILCCDGLKGMPEAVEAAFPNTIVQTCIVHMLRNSARFVPYKDRRELLADLKPIYTADSESSAKTALEDFEKKWNKHYPMIGKSWRSNWERIIPFLDFPNEIRKVIYTTNAIESLNSQIRKVIKTRGSFPNDQAAKKLLYLAIRNATKKWKRPFKEWTRTIHQLAVFFEGRISI